MRLLEIHPSKTGQISCSLVVREDHRSAGVYSALSYCWGDADDTLDVTCNGCKLAVMWALDNALQRFRKPDEVVRLWADALCINQGNISERNQQVSIRARIYDHANRVNVWLGSCDDQAQNAVSLIRNIW
jgi:hypothetical protein